MRRRIVPSRKEALRPHYEDSNTPIIVWVNTVRCPSPRNLSAQQNVNRERCLILQVLRRLGMKILSINKCNERRVVAAIVEPILEEQPFLSTSRVAPTTAKATCLEPLSRGGLLGIWHGSPLIVGLHRECNNNILESMGSYSKHRQNEKRHSSIIISWSAAHSWRPLDSQSTTL